MHRESQKYVNILVISGRTKLVFVMPVPKTIADIPRKLAEIARKMPEISGMRFSIIYSYIKRSDDF